LLEINLSQKPVTGYIARKIGHVWAKNGVE
jgi:hypothetical protein